VPLALKNVARHGLKFAGRQLGGLDLFVSVYNIVI
jgi:hypothetical protein